jgi:DHA1 family multidrug resistance protein-like MFS transporter
VLALVPTLKNTFNVDVGTVLLAITALMIPYAFFQLFTGTMSDVYGRRPVLVAGFLIYGIGLMIIGFSPRFNIGVFLGARFLCGIGFAFIGPVLAAAIGDLTKIEYRGKAMGIYSSVLTSGTALGPLFAGFFAYEWWNIYFMLSGLAFLSMILVWAILGKVNEPKKIDMRLVRQVFVDLKEVCSVKGVLALSAVGFLGFLGFMGVQSFLSDTLSVAPFYLRSDAIGLILSIGGAVVIFFAPLSGYLTDRWGRERIAYVGLAMSVVSLILLFFSQGFSSFMFSNALNGIGSNLFWLPLTAISVELMPRMRGSTSSVFNGVRFFGYALAPYLLTPVYEGWATNKLSSFQIIIIICIILILLTIPLIRYVGKQKLPEMCLEKTRNEKVMPKAP